MLAVENGNVVYRAAGERFDLQVEVHFDGAGALYGGRCLQREAEVLVLNLREW